MTLEEQAFLKAEIDFERLRSYGFVHRNSQYEYETLFMDGDFKAVIIISEDGKITGKVYDLMVEEEYFQLRITEGAGAFVRRVQYAYLEILKEIAENCAVFRHFINDQANRASAYIEEAYGERPEFPWTGEANKTSAVFRNKENGKWFAALLQAEEKRLDAALQESDQRIEILNLKIDPENGEQLRAISGIYPGWHMNHKNWISIRLDDRVDDKKIYELIDRSYQLIAKQTSKRSGGKKRLEPRSKRSWIIPANPKYYDIVTEYADRDESTWRQYRGIEEGDEIFIYVGMPVGAIMYRCLITKAHISCTDDPWYGSGEKMNIRILERYPADAITKKGAMADFGITNVRGPRSMPEKFLMYIQDLMI